VLDATRALRRVASVLALAPLGLLALAACSDGGSVVLGHGAFPDIELGAPTLVAELASAGNVTDPTLTADLLEIYFTATESDPDGDVWVARRRERDAPFAQPTRIEALSSPASESNPAISLDGLTVWFGSDRAGGAGGMDIWQASRADRDAAWSAPILLTRLNSPGNDVPRPPGLGARFMPLGSDRASPGLYQTYLAQRSDPHAPFESPVLVSELSFSGMGTVDGFLPDDGLTLWFSLWTPPAQSDLHLAFRKSAGQPFADHRALIGINGPWDDRDPWLSADGRTLYFASNRAGRFAIYVSTVARQ
jgi:Tol biopolymer transport system component